MLNDRPSPYVAWGMMPKDEKETVVWTDEMATAFGFVDQLISDGDIDQAMIIFVREYKRLCDLAVKIGKPVVWTPSLGHDPKGRVHVLVDAVRKGRMDKDHAIRLFPHMKSEFISIQEEETV